MRTDETIEEENATASVEDKGSAPKSPKERSQSYYERNKEKILKKRKDRYNTDAAYRARIVKASRERRQGKQVVAININGEEVPCFGVKAFSKLIKRSVSTINHWQSHKTAPRTPYTTEAGYRLYTEGMAKSISDALAAIPHPVKGDPEFRALVVEGWRRLGVPI